ncbi:hypothetical protein ASG94_21060 [Nocardioides sp. Soil805]|nr:hypothetical protein ASG94_21060 [Nocardioides sp. Soil805]
MEVTPTKEILMLKLTTTLAAAALLATAGPALTAPGAFASGGSDDETIRTGSCSAGASWKIKAKPDDGRLEVEAEIDSNRVGQTWTWVLKHNGSVSARGASRTAGRSGSFDVERRTVDAAGTDSFRFRATHDGAVCVARLSL